MNHCPIRGISLNYVTEGKWYLPSVRRSYFMRDRTRVSMAGSAFFLVCVLFFWNATSAGTSIISSCRGKVAHKIYWVFDCIRQIIYFTCCESDWWYFVTEKRHWAVGAQITCWSFEQQLPQCQRKQTCLMFKHVYFLKKCNFEFWFVCVFLQAQPRAAWCGFSFCWVLFAPHSSSGKKYANHFQWNLIF